jgi:hypothetical protein
LDFKRTGIRGQFNGVEEGLRKKAVSYKKPRKKKYSKDKRMVFYQVIKLKD